MRELLIATSNKGKLPGMLAALKGVPFTILSLADVEAGPEVEEVAASYDGNAILKAMTYAARTGHLTIADDSGLEIAALGGKPGVFSSRYVSGSDTTRYSKILEEMREVPDAERTATYRSIIALCDPKKAYMVRLTIGIAEGWLTYEPSGTGGFGYDPIFYSNDLKKTFAEATLEECVPVSHRGRALTKMREILKEFV